MNELEQLKAKYQELGAVIERMEKGEAEFKPLKRGWYIHGDADVQFTDAEHNGIWNVMPTEAEAERLGKIFQAVAEQEHLVKFVNGDYKHDVMKLGAITFSMNKRLDIVAYGAPSVNLPIFKDNDAAKRALKLASPNLLAYWKGEL